MPRTFILAVAISACTASAQIPNYIASAGYALAEPTPVAYGQVISLFVVGLNVPDAAAATTTPLPTELSGVRVIVPWIRSRAARISSSVTGRTGGAAAVDIGERL